jgi:sn-glycerol 3-phosphate transport system substrate-binding protein
VRKAIEDQAQAVLSGRKQADEAVRDAQKNADEILRPYNDKIAHVSGL